MKMSVCKLGIAILFALPIELVSSAPSLNKSPKSSSNLMIAANDDILSKEVSGTSNHSLNSTHLDSQTNSRIKAASNNASSTTKESAMESKSLNLTITNTSITVSNFTANGSQSATDLVNLLTDFFSGIIDFSFEKSTIHHTSTTSPTETTTFPTRHSHVSREHNRHSTINPSFHNFISPSLQIFLPFGRLFRNL